MDAGMKAKAYLTYRMTKSWNGVALWTKGDLDSDGVKNRS